MVSRISIEKQLHVPFSKPQEVLTYSKHGEDVVFDDSALQYYYLPQEDVERRRIYLNAGFDAKRFDPDANLVQGSYLDTILEVLVEYENRSAERTDAQIITWRGILRDITTLCQPQCNQMAFNDGLDLLVCGFDNQVFISMDSSKPRKKDPEPTTTEEKFRQVKNLQFSYTGHKFEEVAMLKKPWGQCTRDEIEARYTDTSFHEPESVYCMLISSKIGDVRLMYAAETDGVEGFKPKEGDLHRQYVELKTTNVITNKWQAEQFERKLYKTWFQSFLSRVPKIVYGYRDPQTMQLLATEEFQTNELLRIVNNSPSPLQHKWSAKRTLGFFGVVTKFLKDCVEDGQCYRLTLDQQAKELVLTPTEISIGRKVAFLSDAFVDHRASLRS